MSTNYYWKCSGTLPNGESIPVDDMNPKVHIGKTSAGGGHVKFIWCQDPIKVLEICENSKEEFIISDEYGCDYTGREFEEKVSSCVWLQHMIGKEFF